MAEQASGPVAADPTEESEDLRLFRGVMSSVLRDADDVLRDAEICCNDPVVSQRLGMLKTYINYALRLCHGKT